MNENLEEAVGRVRREMEHEMDTLHKQLQVSQWLQTPNFDKLFSFIKILMNIINFI